MFVNMTLKILSFRWISSFESPMFWEKIDDIIRQVKQKVMLNKGR